MKRNQGFTLIELLVVIAIIGVLSTLGGAGASMVQKQVYYSGKFHGKFLGEQKQCQPKQQDAFYSKQKRK